MKKIPLLFVTFFLAACAGGVKNSPAPTVFDFGVPSARLASEATWTRLALEVKAPYWFDSLNIEYRLLYEDSLRLREYAGSRWAGAPTQLLGQRLRQQLGVVAATGNTAVDCLLKLDLQEFSQVFDSPQQSRGLIQGSLALIDGKRQTVAARVLSIEQPAPTPDARGGVTALVAAVDELGRQMAGWLAALDKSGELGNCRPGRR